MEIEHKKSIRLSDNDFTDAILEYIFKKFPELKRLNKDGENICIIIQTDTGEEFASHRIQKIIVEIYIQ